MVNQVVFNALARAIFEKGLYSTIYNLKRLSNPLVICVVDIEPETRSAVLWATIKAHSKRGEFDMALSVAEFLQRRVRLMKK